MTKFAVTGVFVALAFAAGCVRLAAPFDELGDDEAEDESSDTQVMDTLAVDGESGPNPDMPMEGESTTDECESDVEGLYLLALETALGPDMPLLNLTTIDMDCSSSATITFEWLSVETLEPVGDPLVYEGVEFDAEGNFVVDLGLITVPGEANPITGSDVELTLILTGHVVHVDALCGDATGLLMSPLEYDLAGSTFAMTRVTGPDALPLMFPYRCDQVPPP